MDDFSPKIYIFTNNIHIIYNILYKGCRHEIIINKGGKRNTPTPLVQNIFKIKKKITFALTSTLDYKQRKTLCMRLAALATTLLLHCNTAADACHMNA